MQGGLLDQRITAADQQGQKPGGQAERNIEAKSPRRLWPCTEHVLASTNAILPNNISDRCITYTME